MEHKRITDRGTAQGTLFKPVPEGSERTRQSEIKLFEAL